VFTSFPLWVRVQAGARLPDSAVQGCILNREKAVVKVAEQRRTAKDAAADRRKYRMLRRAELVDQTRQRITQAAMCLHTTVGPSHASIAAIADQAGVTRLTVYRHFRDQDELFAACMGHWLTLHPRPDPAAWSATRELQARARRALTEIYKWYAASGHELYPIYRDIDAVPPSTRAVMDAHALAMAEAITGEDGSAADRGRSLRGVAGHLVSLSTWRSLVLEQGLTNQEAIDLGVTWLVAAAEQPSRAEGLPEASG
jgi:AcrR family transcriptional regulator